MASISAGPMWRGPRLRLTKTGSGGKGSSMARLSPQSELAPPGCPPRAYRRSAEDLASGQCLVSASTRISALMYPAPLVR
jgi:hypothetical protein